jgi:hypothetical protein
MVERVKSASSDDLQPRRIMGREMRTVGPLQKGAFPRQSELLSVNLPVDASSYSEEIEPLVARRTL